MLRLINALMVIHQSDNFMAAVRQCSFSINRFGSIKRFQKDKTGSKHSFGNCHAPALGDFPDLAGSRQIFDMTIDLVQLSLR